MFQILLMMPLMLGVLNPNTLKARIRGRGRDASARRAARYLKGFDEIWRLQSHLLSEADRVGIPIVRNTDPDRVFLQVMRMILDRLSQDFARAPEDVFEQHRRSATA